MKKIVMVLFLVFSLSAIADGHHHAGGWVAPLIGGVIIGGVIGSVSRPHYVEPPVYYGNPYSNPGYGYHYETIFDQYCQCFKTVLVPNY